VPIYNLSYSLRIEDKVSQPWKTTGKMKVLYILIIAFLRMRRKKPAVHRGPEDSSILS
jgi:hypothetical protein